MPQWVFLTSLFNDILVKDRVALAASGSSSKVNLLRRIALGFAVFLGLIFLTGFTISFFQNRGLQNRVRDEIEDLKTVQAPADPRQAASRGDLQKLERLRTDLADLTDWEENGAPWSMRWGLYSGHEVYLDAKPVYFDRFRTILFADTQKRLTDGLSILPDSPPANILNDPQSGDLYTKGYNGLKAYLITTSITPNSCYDQSKVPFLTQALGTQWSADRGIDKERQELAAKQFDFYATELVRRNWFASGNSPTLISHARTYLHGFTGINQLYARLKASVPDPGARSFNERYAKSADIIDSEFKVQGAFTRQGYDAVQNALLHPSEIGGDECVLGPAGAQGVDPVTVRKQLTDMYNDEFVKEWNAVLKTSRFRGFRGDWPDADGKLQRLTDSSSPQMELLYFISHNVNPVPADLKKPFAAVQQLEDPAPTGDDTPPPRYLGDATKQYIDGLVALNVAVHALAQSPGAPDPAVLSQASSAAGNAMEAARKIGSSLPIDHSQTPGNEQQVGRLLQEPILAIENLIQRGPAEIANGSAKGFCSEFLSATARKFPFDPKSQQDLGIDQLNTIFVTGFKKLLDDTNKLVYKVGNQYAPNTTAPVKPSRDFVQFLNRMQALSDVLYSTGGPSPHFSYTLKHLPSNYQGVEVKIGENKLSGEDAQGTFVWTGAPESIEVSKASETLDSANGPWAIFKFISHAHHLAGNNLEWVSEINERPVILSNGKIKSYEFQLQVAGAANPFFDLPGMRCVSQVTGK